MCLIFINFIHFWSYLSNLEFPKHYVFDINLKYKQNLWASTQLEKQIWWKLAVLQNKQLGHKKDLVFPLWRFINSETLNLIIPRRLLRGLPIFPLPGERVRVRGKIKSALMSCCLSWRREDPANRGCRKIHYIKGACNGR